MGRLPMYKFQQRDKKMASNISATDRQRQYLNVTHVFEDRLFCTPCNIVLEHRRKFSIDAHLKTDKHRRAVERAKNGPATKRLKILDFSTTTSSAIPDQEHSNICEEWVAMCAAANIPLSKTDHPAVRTFLQSRVINGGEIPSADTLSHIYLPLEYSIRRAQLKEKLRQKPVDIMCDESSDEIGRFVLNVFASPLVPKEDGSVPSYLLDTVYLETINHSSVSQAVVQTLSSYEINFNDVVVFESDNATYMRKAYTDVLAGLLPNSVHLICMAHIMNVLGEAFRKPFKMVNQFVEAFKAMFWHAGARKGRYIRYLKKVRPEEQPMTAPNPAGARWSCWYDAVAYHLPRLPLYRDFIEQEMAHAKNMTPDTLITVHSLLHDPSSLRVMTAKMNFIVKKSDPFFQMADVFQCQKPTVMKAFTALEELASHFKEDEVREAEASQYFTPRMTSEEKTALRETFSKACQATAEKLKKYMSSEGQPAIKFLRDIRILHPANTATLSPNQEDYAAIPGLEEVPEAEFKLYITQLGPAAVQHSQTSDIDLYFFWRSVSVSVPALANLTLRYIFCVCSSVDVERRLSLYDLLDSSRRRSLSEKSVKILLFLHYNRFSDDAFFEEVT